MAEWGPWIEHDGKGCPCVGMYVQVDWICQVRGIQRGAIIPCVQGSGWTWDRLPAPGRYGAVIRYRIRKPRGLTMLEEISQGIRQPEDA